METRSPRGRTFATVDGIHHINSGGNGQDITRHPKNNIFKMSVRYSPSSSPVEEELKQADDRIDHRRRGSEDSAAFVRRSARMRARTRQDVLENEAGTKNEEADSSTDSSSDSENEPPPLQPVPPQRAPHRQQRHDEEHSPTSMRKDTKPKRQRVSM